MKLLIFVIMIVTSSFAYAERIIVATDIWVGYTNRDGSGYYLDLINEIFKWPKYEVEVDFVPFKRSTVMIQKGHADIMLGAYIDDIPPLLLTDYPVETDSIDAVISKDLAKKWIGIASLKNKNIIAKLGYSFDSLFKIPVKYTEYPDLLPMLNMLKNGKVDAVLDYELDIKMNWDKALLGDNFTIKKSVVVSNAYFGFSENKPHLKKIFQEQFKLLYKSGRIAELMKKNIGNTKKIPIIGYEE